MSTTLVKPASAWSLPGADLERDLNAVRLRPRDASGNWVSAHFPFDEGSGMTNLEIFRWPDRCYGANAEGITRCLASAPGKFGAYGAKVSLYDGSIRFPYNTTKFNNLLKFTMDFFYKPDVVTGVRDIISCHFNQNGFKQWRLQRYATDFLLYIYNEAGTASQVWTEGSITLVAGDYVHVRLTYDGNYADGSCKATISVDGVSRASSSAMKLIPLPTICNVPCLNIGTSWMPFYLGVASWDVGDVCTISDFRILPGVILPATYTPPTSAFLPFALQSESATIAFDAGASGTFDLSTLLVDTPANCNSVVGGAGWEFRYKIDSGSYSDWMTYAAMQAESDPVGTILTVQGRCNSDGISAWYPLAWMSVDFTATPVTPGYPRGRD